MNLLEVLLALSLSGLLGVLVQGFLGQQGKLRENYQEAMAAQTLLQDLNLRTTRETLWASAQKPAQEALAACLGQDGVCSATDGTHQVLFTLYDDHNRGLTHPTTYGKNGRKCEGESCPWDVRGYFWATCPMDEEGAIPSSCTVAESLQVRYQIQVSGGKAYPPNKVFWEDENKLRMTPWGAKVIPIGGQTPYQKVCEDGYTLVSMERGKSQCACLPPMKEIPHPQDPKRLMCGSEAARCPSSQRYRGQTPDGRILCSSFFCETVPSHLTGCRSGGWIQKIRPKAIPRTAQTPVSEACLAGLCAVGKNGGRCESQAFCLYELTCCYDTSPAQET